MQEKAVFHLFIPSLLKSLNSWHQDFLFEVEAPNLSLLLNSYKKKNNIRSKSIDSAFFNTINSNAEELPIAFYRYQAQKNEFKHGLICADPVHLEVSLNDVTLTKNITDLTDSEANELIDILNKHFAEDGLQFIFGSNQCWYMLSGENESFSSFELDSVLMQDITKKLATSKKRNWQVIQNETQMLLHTSEINQQREIAGLETVNSLWFWGAGDPNDCSYDIQKIYSSSEISSKLRGELYAKAANCEWQTIPSDFSESIEQFDKKTKIEVLLLDQLFMPTLENNLDEFQREIEIIDNSIIKPLLKAWKSNEVDIIIDCCDGTILKPQKSPFWKFWSKPTKLREILDEINS